MPKRKSQTTLLLQQLIACNQRLTEAVHTYAQSTQQLAVAVVELASSVGEDDQAAGSFGGNEFLDPADNGAG